MIKTVTLTAPKTESELLNRTLSLAGKSLSELADILNIQLPSSAVTGKGWVGQAIEKFLGATAGSHAEPDFQYLSIELKTLPIDSKLKVKESTFVSMVPHMSALEKNWHESAVYKKLQRILWVPVEAAAEIEFANRRIGNGFLWSPAPEQEQILQNDWEELIELVGFGEFDKISSRQGKYLQIRPKAANSDSVVQVVDTDGNIAETLPRGFYLRTALTNQLLKQINHN